MSASKKTIITKSTKSPAPATKSTPAKPGVTKPAVKKKAAPVASVRATPPVPVAVRAPSPTVAVVKPPAVPAVVKPVATTIVARLDIGFGNALFIRGDGPRLSWDKGLAMDCVGSDLWQIVLEGGSPTITFKFLVNDLSWSSGPDFTASAGGNVTLTPEF